MIVRHKKIAAQIHNKKEFVECSLNKNKKKKE